MPPRPEVGQAQTHSRTHGIFCDEYAVGLFVRTTETCVGREELQMASERMHVVGGFKGAPSMAAFFLQQPTPGLLAESRPGG